MNTFKLASIFSDNMVLQRNKSVKVWGESEENNLITVSIDTIEVTVQAQNGKWIAELPPMEASEACEIRVSSNNEKDYQIIIKNVAIGEVWIAGGQSNMQFELKYDEDGKEAISSANNLDIRFYDCPKSSYEGSEKDYDFSEYGFWRLCTAENASYFSAVAYYFAEKINSSQKVPVGIVGCNWNGSTASTWLDEKYLSEDEELRVYVSEYEAALKEVDLEEYEKKLEQSRLALNTPEFKMFNDGLMLGNLTQEQMYMLASKLNLAALIPEVGPKYFNRPAALYHNMVEKIAGYSAAGVIWYQGESDDQKASIYSKLFSAVIKCWRESWQDELPFLFVQLAPFGFWQMSNGELFPAVREQQEIVSKTISKAYMASIMDAGMENDIHPKRKRPVGERLALLARNKVYGEDIICEAPEVENVLYQGKRIKISFKNVGKEFVLHGDKINGLQVYMNKTEVVRDVRSFVEMNSIIIESEQIKNNKNFEVRFAWVPYIEVNLYSSVGLPVKPFIVTV
jgi:sialate O-acetylesterase